MRVAHATVAAPPNGPAFLAGLPTTAADGWLASWLTRSKTGKRIGRASYSSPAVAAMGKARERAVAIAAVYACREKTEGGKIAGAEAKTFSFSHSKSSFTSSRRSAAPAVVAPANSVSSFSDHRRGRSANPAAGSSDGQAFSHGANSD